MDDLKEMLLSGGDVVGKVVKVKPFLVLLEYHQSVQLVFLLIAPASAVSTDALSLDLSTVCSFLAFSFPFSITIKTSSVIGAFSAAAEVLAVALLSRQRRRDGPR